MIRRVFPLLLLLPFLFACQEDPATPTVISQAPTPTRQATQTATVPSVAVDPTPTIGMTPTVTATSVAATTTQQPPPPAYADGWPQRVPNDAERATLERLYQDQLPIRDDIESQRWISRC